jgi:hypothetical protein
MYVVATAGHVDHGKSTLVRALTGTDPDRLEEEKRRGLSIRLGYCWTVLDGVGEVAFVDVPGPRALPDHDPGRGRPRARRALRGRGGRPVDAAGRRSTWPHSTRSGCATGSWW